MTGSKVAKGNNMIQRIGCIATVAVKRKLLIVINASRCPSLGRKHSLQPCVESWKDQEVARSLLGSATSAGQVECTNIEVMCNFRVAINNMPTGRMYWVSK